MEISEYWNSVRKRVCVQCADGNNLGDCRLSEPPGCTLKTYFPLIVNAVERVEASHVQDYTTELLPIVCAQCARQSVNGQCLLRSSRSCALDRYYLLLVATVTAAREQYAAKGESI